MNPMNPMNSTNPTNSRLSTILVTGGAGFIGSHLCDRLLDDGYKVVCLDNFNDFYDPAIKERNIFQASKHANFTLIRGDILDTELLDQVFSGELEEASDSRLSTPDSRPLVVVHLAASAGVRPSLVSPAQYVDVDIKGTVNLLEVAKEHNVDQFIFGSSSSVYGARQDGPFSEDDPTDAQVSPYATAKKAGELYCRTYANLYGIPTTVLRFFTVYGPRQRPEMAIHKFVRLMEQGGPIPMYGDGSSARDYTYIDDIVDGIMEAVKHPFGFEIFNLGNSITIKLKDLIELIGQELDVHPRIEQQPDQPGDVLITYADISKARSLLGYNPKVPLEEGIKRFIRWVRESA